MQLKPCIYRHNIIPCWEVSNKLEYAARTIRPKIMKRLYDFLPEQVPALQKMSELPNKLKVDFVAEDLMIELKASHGIDCTMGLCDEYYPPGEENGLKRLDAFLSKTRLGRFHSHANDPNHDKVISGLSPYLNFGQVSVQRAILIAKAYANENKISSEAINAFIEQVVVRRELSDNFCFFNPNYDNLTGAYGWAQETLEVHKGDKRQYVYTEEELQKAETHDDLWNASQQQLNTEGKLHGFLRMYWAKKILEWTSSPKEALRIGQYLNDSLALDGNDPNGYVGVGWSIMGIHDQGWKEREVFGKIRFMNYNGCKRKFNVKAFVSKYSDCQSKISGARGSKRPRTKNPNPNPNPKRGKK